MKEDGSYLFVELSVDAFFVEKRLISLRRGLDYGKSL